MTELSEFLALLQFEVQKSFDFSEQLMHDLSETADPLLQLAYDSVEMELPLVFNVDTKAAPASSEPSDDTPRKPGLLIHDLNASFAGAATIDQIKFAPTKAKEAVAAQIGSKKKAARGTKSAIAKQAVPSDEVQQMAKFIQVQTLSKEVTGTEGFDMAQIGRLKVTLKPVVK